MYTVHFILYNVHTSWEISLHMLRISMCIQHILVYTYNILHFIIQICSLVKILASSGLAGLIAEHPLRNSYVGFPQIIPAKVLIVHAAYLIIPMNFTLRINFIYTETKGIIRL